MNFIHTVKDTNYSLTKHAERRAQQRGIKLETINFILHNADVHLHAGKGGKSLRISQRELVRLAQDGASASLIDWSRGVVLVVQPCQMLVVTVLHDYGTKAGRCYRSQWPTRSEKHCRLHRRPSEFKIENLNGTGVIYPRPQPNQIH
jgi:hypothetical protein